MSLHHIVNFLIKAVQSSNKTKEKKDVRSNTEKALTVTETALLILGLSLILVLILVLKLVKILG